MADDLRMALGEVLRKAQGERDVDFLREGVRVFSQALMELEAVTTAYCGEEGIPLQFGAGAFRHAGFL